VWIDNDSVCHVVRRFGLVGGMEGYVWRLAHAQAAMGYKISVITETVFGEPDQGIKITIVPSSPVQQRWRQMLYFRDVVNAQIQLTNGLAAPLIHSHERCFAHHVTTFHGPPMVPRRLESLFSRRVAAWQAMERIEIFGQEGPIVVPVSRYLGDRLKEKYPEAKSRITDPVYPAVESKTTSLVKSELAKGGGSRLLFVGVDWKRKGLPFVLEVFGCLLKRSSAWTLHVVGSEDKKAKRLVEGGKGCFMGWQDKIDYAYYDVLVLPSVMEPFGMVVSEARQAGCRVVCSNQVGAVELHEADTGLIQCDSNCSVDKWADAIEMLSKQESQPYSVHRSWNLVAQEYGDRVYPIARAGLSK
jgi:glycosyltransferase involved in cell wall biosynthesis